MAKVLKPWAAVTLAGIQVGIGIGCTAFAFSIWTSALHTVAEEVERAKAEAITPWIVSAQPYTEPIEEEPIQPYTDDEIDLIANVVAAESLNQGLEGQQYVAAVILNRIESPYFPDTAREVLYQQGQFECVTDGGIERHKPTEETYQAVTTEIQSRTNGDILFFRTGHYHGFGTPILQYKDHYFSGR